MTMPDNVKQIDIFKTHKIDNFIYLYIFMISKSSTF